MSVWVFWIALTLIAYAYVLYPLLVVALAKKFGSMPVERSSHAAADRDHRRVQRGATHR